MKTLMFLITFGLIGLLTLGSIPFVPYFFYKKVIDEGYQSRFISLSIERKELLKGKEKGFRKIDKIPGNGKRPGSLTGWMRDTINDSYDRRYYCPNSESH